MFQAPQPAPTALLITLLDTSQCKLAIGLLDLGINKGHLPGYKSGKETANNMLS